jgi:hypothetical protein
MKALPSFLFSSRHFAPQLMLLPHTLHTFFRALRRRHNMFFISTATRPFFACRQRLLPAAIVAIAIQRYHIPVFSAAGAVRRFHMPTYMADTLALIRHEPRAFEKMVEKRRRPPSMLMSSSLFCAII